MLLIDEGSGSFSCGRVDLAVKASEPLQRLSCKVGVVTRVTAKVERIPTQVKVTERGDGRSVVVVQAV